MRGFERFGKLNGGIAADRVTDNGDRLRVVTVVVDGLVGDAAPAHVRIGGRQDAAAIDALRELVHAPIDCGNQTVEQIGASVHMLSGLLLGRAGRNEADNDRDGGQDSGDMLDFNHAP